MADEKISEGKENGKTAPVLNFSKKHREPAKKQKQEAPPEDEEPRI